MPWQDRLAGATAITVCAAAITATVVLGTRSTGVLWAASFTLIALAAWRLN